MAIKINNLTVVNNDRVLENILDLDATTRATIGTSINKVTNISATTSTTNLDLSVSRHFHITLQTDTALTVSNIVSNIGASGTIVLIQDATGGRVFTKSAEMKTPINGASIDQVTSSNSVSIISYYVLNSTNILINYIGGFA